MAIRLMRLVNGADISATSSLIAIRRAERKQLAVRPRLINCAGDGGSCKYSAAIGASNGKAVAHGMNPVRVEECWCCGAIRERKFVAGRPCKLRNLFVEPSVSDIEQAFCLIDPFGVALLFG